MEPVYLDRWAICMLPPENVWLGNINNR